MSAYAPLGTPVTYKVASADEQELGAAVGQSLPGILLADVDDVLLKADVLVFGRNGKSAFRGTLTNGTGAGQWSASAAFAVRPSGVFTDEVLHLHTGKAQENTSTPFASHWYFESTDGLPSFHQAVASGIVTIPLPPALYPAGTIITGYRAKMDPQAAEVVAVRLVEDDPGPAATVGVPAGAVKATVNSDGTNAAQVVTKSGISVTLAAAKNYAIEVIGSAAGAGSTLGSVRVSGVRP